MVALHLSRFQAAFLFSVDLYILTPPPPGVAQQMDDGGDDGTLDPNGS